jgi:hypothetical protein
LALEKDLGYSELSHKPILAGSFNKGVTIIYKLDSIIRDQSSVRSDHLAAVAFRKIRSHFFLPFFVGWDYFFPAFVPLSSTLTGNTIQLLQYHVAMKIIYRGLSGSEG